MSKKPSYKLNTKKQERDGDGRRVPRVEKEIREVVGHYLLRGFRGNLPGIVSVTRVIASKDLKNAKILVTIMSKSKLDLTVHGEPSENLKKSCLSELKTHVHEIQFELNRQLKMKNCPRLTFFYDEGVGHALKIEGILRKLKPNP